MESTTTSKITGKPYSPQIIFARNTKELIQNKIKGSVRTYYFDDVLIIKIFGANNIVFDYTMNNLSHAIVQGFTSDRLAQIIVKRYTAYIRNLFFL